jgi:hypothetical protein
MPDPTGHTERDRTDEQDDVRPGSPPRHATQPKGSESSTRSKHTLTDPGTGAPNPKRGDH